MPGTLVRSVYLDTAGYVSDASVTLTGVTAGNRIFLSTHVWDDDTGYGEQSPHTVASSPAETWSQDFNSNIAKRAYWNNNGGDGVNGGNRISLWSAVVGTSGDHTITASWYGSKVARLTAFEFSGIPAGAVDVVAQTDIEPAVSGSSVSVTTGALSTNSEVIFALSALDTNGGSATITKPGAFTAIVDQSSYTADFLNVSSNSPVSATWTLSASPQGALNVALIGYKSTLVLANITAPSRTFAVSSNRTAAAPTATRNVSARPTSHNVFLAYAGNAPNNNRAATPAAYRPQTAVSFTATPAAGGSNTPNVTPINLNLQDGSNLTLQDGTSFYTIATNTSSTPSVLNSNFLLQNGVNLNLQDGSVFNIITQTSSSVESTDYLMLLDGSPLAMVGGGNIYFNGIIPAALLYPTTVAFNVRAPQVGISAAAATRNFAVPAAFVAQGIASSSVSAPPAFYSVGVAANILGALAPRNIAAGSRVFAVSSQYSVGTTESTDYLTYQDITPFDLYGGGFLHFHSNNQLLAVNNSHINAYVAPVSVSINFGQTAAILNTTQQARSFTASVSLNATLLVATPSVPNRAFAIPAAYQAGIAFSKINAVPATFSTGVTIQYQPGTAGSVRRAAPITFSPALAGAFVRGAPVTVRTSTVGTSAYSLTASATLRLPIPSQRAIAPPLTANAAAAFVPIAPPVGVNVKPVAMSRNVSGAFIPIAPPVGVNVRPVAASRNVSGAFIPTAPLIGVAARPILLSRNVASAFVRQPPLGARNATPSPVNYASGATFTGQPLRIGVAGRPSAANYSIAAARTTGTPDTTRNGLPIVFNLTIRPAYVRGRPVTGRGLVTNTVLRNAAVRFQPIAPKTTQTAPRVYISLGFKQPYTATMKLN